MNRWSKTRRTILCATRPCICTAECKSYQISVFFSIYFSFAIPSHEQMFQCEASGNEAGGEEGAVLDAEKHFSSMCFRRLFCLSRRTLCGLRRGKALLGKFLEVRREKKVIIKFSSFFVVLPMTTSKVKTISSAGGLVTPCDYALRAVWPGA